MLAKTKLSKLELKILDTIWTRGEASIREAQEAFPEKDRPAYTTVQTMMYRLEAKKAVRRTRKVGNFHVFAAEITRTSAQRKLVDDLLEIFAGDPKTLLIQLIESGKLTLANIKDAEKRLKNLAK
jgi:predicted transcriptional regulator